VEVLVFSGSLTSLWLASFGPFACLDFGPGPLFLFLSLSWVLSFYKVGQGFITCLLFSEGHLPCSKVSNLGAECKPVSGGSFFYEEPLVPIILKKKKTVSVLVSVLQRNGACNLILPNRYIPVCIPVLKIRPSSNLVLINPE